MGGTYSHREVTAYVIAVNATIISLSATEGLIVILWLFYFTESSCVLEEREGVSPQSEA